MQLGGLSLDQAPPISVPFRFFFSGALFGLLGAVLIIYWGPTALVSRWTPALLAITHALVLGFFGSVMFGALQQMLPVLAGAVIARPKFIAWLVHVLWVAGVLTLLLAFLWAQAAMFMIASVLLGGAILVLVIAAAQALLQAKSQSHSVGGMKLALVALFLTLGLGVILAFGQAGKLPLWRPWGTNLHLMWGLLGWVGLLITSVAWQVVPMFQITNPYPQRLVLWLAPSLFALLVLRSLVIVLAAVVFASSDMWQWVYWFIDIAVSWLLLSFAYHTLRLQRQRLRKIKDTHINYWQVACVSLLLALLAWWLAGILVYFSMETSWIEPLKMLALVLFLAGFVMAIITAMLYKIVAFLVWFHLQAINSQYMMKGRTPINVPHMKGVMPVSRAKAQFWLYCLALATACLACLWPFWFARLAGFVWSLYFISMAINLSHAMLVYRAALKPEY